MLFYAVVSNGAVIRCHDTFDRAMEQAKHWKFWNADKRVVVETLTRDKGPYQHAIETIEVTDGERSQQLAGCVA